MTRQPRIAAKSFPGYFPEVRVNAAGGRVYGDNATSRGLSVTRGAGYSGYGEGGISLTQMLFDGFEVSHRVDAAKARRLSAASNVVDIREALGYRTAQAYLDVLRTREALDMARWHEVKTNDYIARISNMVKEGASDEAELQQAQDIKHLLGNILADYEGQHLSALARYEEAAGHMPEGEMPRPQPLVSLIPEAQADALDYAAANHPILKAAGYTAEATGDEIEAEKAAPVSGFQRRNVLQQKGSARPDRRQIARCQGAGPNWNFSTGGAQLARIEKKRYEFEQMNARKQEMLRQIERDTQIAYAEMATARKQFDLNVSRKTIQQGLLQTYKNQFEGGKITLLQLLQAENQLFNAELRPSTAITG